MRANQSKVQLGARFGLLWVIEREPKVPAGHFKTLCLCRCGQTKRVWSTNLATGRTVDCGCTRPRSKSNPTGLKPHAVKTRDPHEGCYRKMIDRCYRKECDSFRWYGAKGVTVCDRWLNGENGMTGLACFRLDMGPRPSQLHTLDRKDGSLPYEPSNCHWATALEQTKNRAITKWVTYKCETRTLTEWCELLGLRYDRTYSRLYRQGWTIEQSLEYPSLTGK